MVRQIWHEDTTLRELQQHLAVVEHRTSPAAAAAESSGDTRTAAQPAQRGRRIEGSPSPT